MILPSTEEVRSGQRSKAFVLATTSVQLNKIGGSRIYITKVKLILSEYTIQLFSLLSEVGDVNRASLVER